MVLDVVSELDDFQAEVVEDRDEVEIILEHRRVLRREDDADLARSLRL